VKPECILRPDGGAIEKAAGDGEGQQISKLGSFCNFHVFLDAAEILGAGRYFPACGTNGSGMGW